MLEIVSADRSDAIGFVRGLNRKIVRKRFPNIDLWEPSNIVIARVDGRSVAMADAVVSKDGVVANASLLAAPGFGGYAVGCILALKRIVKVQYWESSLRTPELSTVAISRRYFDYTVDQFCWDLSNRLAEMHGPKIELMPTPLLIADATLRKCGIPLIRKIDDSSRAQILAASANPGSALVEGPKGFVLSTRELLPLAFDLLGIEMTDRQSITRLLIVSMASMYGHRIDAAEIKNIVDPEALPRFQARVESWKDADTSTGIFRLLHHKADPKETLRSIVERGMRPS